MDLGASGWSASFTARVGMERGPPGPPALAGPSLWGGPRASAYKAGVSQMSEVTRPMTQGALGRGMGPWVRGGGGRRAPSIPRARGPPRGADDLHGPAPSSSSSVPGLAGEAERSGRERARGPPSVSLQKAHPGPAPSPVPSPVPREQPGRGAAGADTHSGPHAGSRKLRVACWELQFAGAPALPPGPALSALMQASFRPLLRSPSPPLRGSRGAHAHSSSRLLLLFWVTRARARPRVRARARALNKAGPRWPGRVRLKPGASWAWRKPGRGGREGGKEQEGKEGARGGPRRAQPRIEAPAGGSRVARRPGARHRQGAGGAGGGLAGILARAAARAGLPGRPPTLGSFLPRRTLP
ncbi:uncharacterized protein LOC141520829 [Macrotis lagotis]|uniref:uncharacterized protein LOC141520829 n=1 Tax=Macrotis lagotis TaxID=92651 RepID=UPI003D68FB97